MRALTLISCRFLLAAITAPTVLNASSAKTCEGLQGRRASNASNERANLSLEKVNFSSRGAVLTNLPGRTSKSSPSPIRGSSRTSASRSG